MYIMCVVFVERFEPQGRCFTNFHYSGDDQQFYNDDDDHHHHITLDTVIVIFIM